MKVAKGWNYVAILIDEIYEYSYATMYLRNELNTGSQLFSKYESFTKGVRYFGIDDTLNLGCFTKLAMGGTLASQDSAWSFYPSDV